MARTNRKAKAAPKPDNGNATTMKDQANVVLDESKNKFEGVLVIGVTDTGHLDINSNVTQYPWLQYALQRAGFELLIHEKNQINAKNEAAADVAVS